MKIGILGAGYIANEHLKVLSSIKSVKLISIFSRTKKKSLTLYKKYNIQKIDESFKDFISSNKFDGIYVLVSAEENYKILKKLIPYSIPLFIEKPAGLNPKETLQLVKLADEYKTINLVGYNRRFYSIFTQCLPLISNKSEISNIIIEGHERFWKLPNDLSKKIKDNWIYSNSTHTIDLLLYFGGDIKKIYNFNKNNNNEKNYTSIVLFQNNIIGSYQSNWSTPSGWSVRIYTNKYYIHFQPLEEGYYVDKQFKKKYFTQKKYDKIYKTGFYMQTKNFLKLIKNKKIEWPAVDLKKTYKTMKLAKSIKNGDLI